MAAAAEKTSTKPNINNVKYSPVTEGTPILSQVIVINEEESPIIPIRPHRNNWHFGLFERCCACGGDCIMAWMCACVPLGQIASKLKQVGNPYCIDYTGVILLALLLLIVDSIVKGDISFFNIGLFTITAQLRGIVRNRFNINGGVLEDAIFSIFCAPCVITQMVGQLWSDPHSVPGFDVTEGPAFIL